MVACIPAERKVFIKIFAKYLIILTSVVCEGGGYKKIVREMEKSQILTLTKSLFHAKRLQQLK